MSQSTKAGHYDAIEESKFIVSNEWQDKALGTGVNFCHRHFSDFHYVIEHINDFIQKAKVDANAVPEVANAYPMLEPLYQAHGESDYLDIGAVSGDTLPVNCCASVRATTRALAQLQCIVEVDSSSVSIRDADYSSHCDQSYESARQDPIAHARSTYIANTPSLLVG
jgi:hypothetical protein